MVNNCEAAKIAMMRLDFVNCFKFLEQERKENAKSNLAQFIELKTRALKILINENHQDLKEWESQLEKFERGLKEKNFTGKDNFLWRAELLLMKSFLNIRAEKYVIAVKDFNDCYNYYSSGLKRYPDNLELQKGIALVRILLGVVPVQYQWALKLFGFEGDIVAGFDALKRIILSCNDPSLLALKEESLFLYATLSVNFGKKNEDLLKVIYSNQFHVSQNPLVRYAFVSALLKETNADSALDMFGISPIQETLPHLHYLKGYLLLLNGNPKAEQSFKYFLQIHKGKMLKAAAYQKLSWYYYLNSDLKRSFFYNSKIGELTVFPTDEDLQAKNTSVHPLPAKCLLRARLDFDGGFFQKSLTELLSCEEGELKNTSEHLEFLYRLGRVQQKLGNIEKALHYFDLTIQRGSKHKDYFAPAAALYAGNLTEEAGNLEKARKYYLKVFEFHDYPYERSLSQKAKAGISRIKDLP